jgi:hypothetical protein
MGDAQDMNGVIGSDLYDTVLWLDVLEHVEGGIRDLQNSQTGDPTLGPHLSRLHEVPYDFYHDTNGLRYLLEVAAFRQISSRDPLDSGKTMEFSTFYGAMMLRGDDGLTCQMRAEDSGDELPDKPRRRRDG